MRADYCKGEEEARPIHSLVFGHMRDDAMPGIKINLNRLNSNPKQTGHGDAGRGGARGPGLRRRSGPAPLPRLLQVRCVACARVWPPLAAVWSHGMGVNLACITVRSTVRGLTDHPLSHHRRNGRRVRVLTVPDAHKALEACRSFAVSMDEEEEEEDEGAAANGDGNGNGAKQGRLRRLPLVDRIERGKPLLLFVAGDRSKVGKSRCDCKRMDEQLPVLHLACQCCCCPARKSMLHVTMEKKHIPLIQHTPIHPHHSVCLGLMGALLRVGFEPQDLAYIKPATQCESPQARLLLMVHASLLWF